MKKNNESMSKFDKLVEVAKNNIEAYILMDAGPAPYAVCLPTNTKDLILMLGDGWLYESMLSAGYAGTTAHRKMMNRDVDKLVDKLDTWYKTELYPKLYNRLKSENREIITLESPKINENKIKIAFDYFVIYKKLITVYGKYNFRLTKVEPEERAKAEALLKKLVEMGIYEYNGPMYALEEELKQYE